MSAPKRIVLISPFLITIVNVIIAFTFGEIIGKWAFIPIVLIEWVLFLFFVFKYGGGAASIKKWLQKPKGFSIWTALTVLMGLITLPLFLMHYNTLTDWKIWLPWLLLALINPWIEEFYYRGFLLDNTREWKNWKAILFSFRLT